MNRLFKVLFFSLFIFSASSISAQIIVAGGPMEGNIKQETIDDATFQVKYDYKSIRDTLKPDKYIEDLFLLEIGKNKISKFYSDNIRVRDSILAEARKQAAGGNMNVNFGRGSRAGSAEQSIVYKNYPAGKLTVTDGVVMTNYLYEEKMNELMQWEILSETMTILEYPCQKAVTNFRGRQYEAWFTLEIPISDGPWKFCGLPGLILQVSDSKKNFIYQCNSISKISDPILYAKREYMKTSRKDLAKIKKKFAEDPVGAMKNSMPGANVQIKMRDESGGTVENPKFPYNPIELY